MRRTNYYQGHRDDMKNYFEFVNILIRSIYIREAYRGKKKHE